MTWQQGEMLRLVREAANPHDRNAIAMRRADGRKLGYVPRHAALTLAPMLDGGLALSARVKGRVVPGQSFDGLVRTGAAPGDPIVALALLA